ncbi:flocculation protein FLO11-like [Oreochromis aureus]|uniref:flocculation protein FLO11-like n=1 Tax=Oreochromis aureus TaxID=47969 RepID=UPI0019532884|nr:flocculation protein FLO11-like [Oreochromis aureus]
MSTGTQAATHVRYSKGVRVDGGEKSQVEIQEHEDCSISPGLQETGQHTQMNHSSAKRSHFRVIAATLGAFFVLMLTVIVSRGITATLQSEQTSTLHSHLTTETTHEKVNAQPPTDNPSTTSIPFSQDVNNRATQKTNEKVNFNSPEKMMTTQSATQKAKMKTTQSTTEKAKMKTTQSTTKKVNFNSPEKMMTTQSATQKAKMKTTQSITEKAKKMTTQSTTQKAIVKMMTTQSTTKKVNVNSPEKMMTTQSATQKGYSCPVGWLRAGSNCYYQLNERRSSQENESDCQRKGGSLIVVNSREKQRILNGETTKEVQQCGIK